MIRVLEVPANALNEWDQWVARASAGTLFQTTMWGRYCAEYSRGTVRYWAALDERDQPLAVMLVRRDPLVLDHLLDRPLQSLLLRVGAILMPRYLVHDGPVLLTDERIPETLGALGDRLRQMIRRRNALAGLRVITPFLGADYSAAYAKMLGALPGRTRFAHTLIIDLDKEEDALWASLKRSARKAVRREQDREVSVTRLQGEEELREYYRVCREARRQMGLRMFSWRTWQTMWRCLSPAEAVHMFVARKDGRIIGGLGIWAFNRHLYEFAAIRVPAPEQSNVGDLLKWEIIRWGRERGFLTYDLAGVNVAPNATEKERRILQFKSKWGGQLRAAPVLSWKGIFGASRA